jgi:hypothetical protein
MFSTLVKLLCQTITYKPNSLMGHFWVSTYPSLKQSLEHIPRFLQYFEKCVSLKMTPYCKLVNVLIGVKGWKEGVLFNFLSKKCILFILQLIKPCQTL